MQQHDEIGLLRAHVRHLSYAVATTTCRETVGALQDMLMEAQARLSAHEAALSRIKSPAPVQRKDS